MGENTVNKDFYSKLSIDNPINRQIDNIQNKITYHEELTTQTRMTDTSLFKDLSPLEYLNTTSHNIPDNIISSENLSQIRKLAGLFSKGTTSFFGFETRLGSTDASSDYLFAVSSKNMERDALMRFLKYEIPDDLKNKSEWRNLFNFTMKWSDSESDIYKNVLGLWLEFDTAKLSENYEIPNVFLQIRKTRIDNYEDEQKFKWVILQALPLLTGESLPKKIEENLINALKKLPKETSLIHVGTMLSRKAYGVRIVINRIKPEQIIPYLKSIGYNSETSELNQTINEISKYSSRLILHINIGEKIDSKVGIECSFAEDKYHLQNEWKNLFDYLEKKGLCIREKREALLDFPGVAKENDDEFNLETYMVAPKIDHNKYSSALVRYLSHIKIVYKPNEGFEAKAYPGVRLFGKPF